MKQQTMAFAMESQEESRRLANMQAKLAFSAVSRTQVVKEIRDQLKQEREKPGGVRCPCCDQFVKLYRRTLNSGMARSLIWLVRYCEGMSEDARKFSPWVDVPKVAPRDVIASREFGKLEHWGLVKQAVNTSTKQQCSGFWMPTERGVDFVHARILVPARVFLYDNKIEGWSEDTISIQEALGMKFDYTDLMTK